MHLGETDSEMRKGGGVACEFRGAKNQQKVHANSNVVLVYLSIFGRVYTYPFLTYQQNKSQLKTQLEVTFSENVYKFLKTYQLRRKLDRANLFLTLKIS